jgi:hypothetical protein
MQKIHANGFRWVPLGTRNATQFSTGDGGCRANRCAGVIVRVETDQARLLNGFAASSFDQFGVIARLFVFNAGKGLRISLSWWEWAVRSLGRTLGVNAFRGLAEAASPKQLTAVDSPCLTAVPA